MEKRTFYGIEDIEYIWHGEWSDPGIRYKGCEINYYTIENSMWAEWCEENGGESSEEGFAQYVKDNADEVRYLCELALGLSDDEYLEAKILLNEYAEDEFEHWYDFNKEDLDNIAVVNSSIFVGDTEYELQVNVDIVNMKIKAFINDVECIEPEFEDDITLDNLKELDFGHIVNDYEFRYEEKLESEVQ